MSGPVDQGGEEDGVGDVEDEGFPARQKTPSEMILSKYAQNKAPSRSVRPERSEMVSLPAVRMHENK